MRKSFATATTLALFAGLAWGAFASSVAHAAAQPPAQTSLAQVVRVAEQRTGGRARKVEMENERGVDVYEIKTVSKDKSTCVIVSAASGDVVRVNTQGFMSTLFEREDLMEDQADLARLEASALTLAGAIESVENETGGRAVEAWLISMYGSTLFEVHVVKDWVKQKVLVDPATSKVITIPSESDENGD